MNRTLFVALASLCTLATTAKDFNVRDFGAKGDGVADDGPAIRRALAEAKKRGVKRVTLLFDYDVPKGEETIEQKQEETAKKILAAIKDMGIKSKFMHICGTHQDTIVRFGLTQMLADAGVEGAQRQGFITQ